MQLVPAAFAQRKYKATTNVSSKQKYVYAINYP
jgi:hypothetical protein